MTADPLALSGGTPGGAMETLQQMVKPVGLLMTEDHRYYWNGDGPYPSVTTILKVLDKPAVTQWVARESVRALVLAWDNRWLMDWGGMDADSLVDWAMAQPREVTDTAAKLGTSVHLLADMESRGEGAPQTAATGFQISPEQIPYLQGFRAFLAFLEAQGAHIVSSEKAIISKYGYGGTYDLLVSFPPGSYEGLWLLDLKTSKGYYPEYALQLAGYGMADFIALAGDPTEYPMPTVNRYGVLHLRPDQYPDTGWRLVEYPITSRDQRAFLAALDLYEWKSEGRFTKSILQKALIKGELEGIRSDPLAKE